MSPDPAAEPVRSDPLPSGSELRMAAKRALAMLDLTDLSDRCGPGDIEALCVRALDRVGAVAAVCIWPQFVSQAARLLDRTGVRIATVVNFPEGTHPRREVRAVAAQAIADGADEIDLVFPWQAFLAADEAGPVATVASIRGCVRSPHLLKVILETGLYPDQCSVNRAAEAAIESGADFLKTSTGKRAISATLTAVETLLEAIRRSSRSVGVKPSGGIQTVAQAVAYLRLADRVMGPAWAGPATFRFGASALHSDITRILNSSMEQDADPRVGT